MSQLPVDLTPSLADRLRAAFDIEGKIPRALEALGPVSGRDVVVIDGDGSPVTEGIEALGARVRPAVLDGTNDPDRSLRLDASDGTADAVVGLWSAFRGPRPADLAEVDRVLRPDGRHLVIHDYGRDDVSRLFDPDRPEYGAWSHRSGPFLAGGFRVRVLHCWWTFESLDAAVSFLSEAFPGRGPDVAASLRRPRLAYKVAVYHRSRGSVPGVPAAAAA